MILVGLTGSIGMGKSTTANIFRELGVPVYDADAAVHGLYVPGGAAVAPIEAAFPGVTSDEKGVDRIKLRERIIHDAEAMKRLELIVHPLVRQVQVDFLKAQAAAGEKVVILDIPLLFETGGHLGVDYVIVVSAPEIVQKERVLAREGMTLRAFEAILAKQTPDSVKRAQADFIIDTSVSIENAREQAVDVLEQLRDLARKKDERPQS